MKYYYTDPLKAAWMAREFGIKYEKIECPHNTDDLMIEIVPCINLSAEDSAEIKIYIHPDCHELLKPQVGDLIKFRYKYAAYVYAKDLKSIPADKSQHSDPCFTMRDSEIIIQRQGKAWFAPMEEK